jgi:hypothetical protein
MHKIAGRLDDRPSRPGWRGALVRQPGREGAGRCEPSPGHWRPSRRNRRRPSLRAGAPRPNRSAGELALIEYTPAGHLDRRFGTGGIARSQLPGERVRRFTGVDPRAITFDAAGDPIVVGTHHIQTVDTPAGEGFIARYTPHGRDCSFGDDGVLADEHFGGMSAVTVQPDGRILAAGWGNGKRFLAARYLGGPARTCPGEPQR